MPTGPGPLFWAPPGLQGEKPLPAPGSGRGAFIGLLGPLSAHRHSVKRHLPCLLCWSQRVLHLCRLPLRTLMFPAGGENLAEDMRGAGVGGVASNFIFTREKSKPQWLWATGSEPWENSKPSLPSLPLSLPSFLPSTHMHLRAQR